MEVVITEEEIKDALKLHRRLAKQLGFSEEYGENLDALYDELVSIGEAVSIRIISDSRNFFNPMLQVLQDAASENSNLKIEQTRFRKMRRWKQEVSKEECETILREEPRGILAVLGDNSYPYAMPVNFLYEDGKLYIHGAGTGHKADAIKRWNKVSFCLYNSGFQKEGEWAWNITSVVCFGRIHIVEDQDEAIEVSRRLARKYYPDEASIEEEIKKAGSRVKAFVIEIEHMTGKLVNES